MFQVLCVQLLSCVRFFMTPWTVALQAPLSMGFPRQEYWSGLPFPPSGDLPDPGIKPASLVSHCIDTRILYYCTTWEAPLCSISSVQFSSVAQSCLTLCDPMDCSTPGCPVHHQLLELAQIRVHQVSDAIQPSHPLLSCSPPAFSFNQHQGLIQ